MTLIQTMSQIGLVAAVSSIVVSGCSGESSVSRTEGASVDSNVEVSADETSSADFGSNATTTGEIPIGSTEPVIFDFEASDSAIGWNVVNDTVMGGVSSGQVVVIDDSLVFTGELSLDNNGGFASVRSPVIEPQSAEMWSNREGPQIVFAGDGRTWTVEVRTDDAEGGWIAELPTVPDSLISVTLPWTSFESVTRFLEPREADGPLDPSRIVSIAFYLVDGIEGSFRLEILSIG